MPDISPEEIAANANKPKTATVDGASAAQHSLPDQIAADRYAKANAAGSVKGFGLRFARLRNQGTK